MFVRMAKTRKTFMLTISQNGRHTHETLGQYPGWLPRRGRACGLARAPAQPRRQCGRAAYGRG